ncbi:hybrid sensor histidine kinase/response regulator [Congregicoccus parvus]|uniref:hybrid sensor histidine kinase/response regulator n=1 Tax=Congregicoccus parvus TaxID=3081749 RepID=UPI003FA551E0
MLVVASVLFPSALLVSWLITRTYQTQRQVLERNLSESVQALSLLVDATLREREAALRALATSPELLEGDITRFRLHVESLLRTENEWIILSDAAGRQLVNTSRPATTPLPVSDVLAGSQEIAWGGPTYVSNLTVGALSGRHVVYVTVPVVSKDQGRLTLTAVLSTAAIADTLLRHGIGLDWLIALIDREGTIMARSRDAERYVGQSATDRMRAAIAESQGAGLIESVTLDGVYSVTAFHRSRHTGWTVVLAAPRSGVLATARTLAAVGVVVSILTALAGIVLAASAGRAVVHGVNTLVRQTRTLGDAPAPAPETGMDETDLVARALVEAAHALKSREAELERARDDALAASRAKDHFLATLSHELRTPLNPVLMLATEALADPTLTAETREMFETIARNVRLEARLIDDLLDVTRITRGKLVLEKRPLDLHRVVADAVHTVRNDAVAKGVTLAVHLDSPRSTVAGDAVRLQQVFWNLLNNAIKFSPGGGSVRVHSTTEDDAVLVTVADEGIGLTPAESVRIFQPFTQGEHAERPGGSRYGGLGLGLAISRLIVEEHAGTLVASSPGRNRGAVFTVRLPSTSVPELAAATPEDIRAESGKPRSAEASGLAVLLVEDHAPTRTVLRNMLKKRGHSVDAASTVAEALALAESRRFDLVVSDIGLPDGDGCTLMRTLRERHGLVGIALSGYGAEADVERGRAAGFAHYLTKPVERVALDDALARMSRSIPSKPPE